MRTSRIHAQIHPPKTPQEITRVVHHHPFVPRASFLLTCLLALVSCSSQPSTIVENNVVPATTSTPLTESHPGNSVLPTMTSVATATVSYTPTTWPTQPLTSANLDSLEELNRWGRGSVLQLQKLANKQSEYLVLTPLGLYWYGGPSPVLLSTILDVDSFVLSADQRFLAVSKKNGDVELWSVDSMSLKQTISHLFPADIVQKIDEHKLLPYYVGGLAFSPDGAQLAVGYVDGKIELWRIGETTPYATLQHESFALWPTDSGLSFQLSFSPDNGILAAFKFEPYLHSNRITFWSIPEAKLIAVSDAGRYYQIPKTSYLPDQKTLLVLSKDDSYFKINLWDVATGGKIDEFGTGLVKIYSTELSSGTDQLTLYGSDAQETYYRQVRELPSGKLVETETLDRIPEDEDLGRFKSLLLEQGHYDHIWGSEDDLQKARFVGTERLPIKIAENGYILTLPDGTIKPATLPTGISNAYYDPQGRYVAWCEPGTLSILSEDGTTTSIAMSLSSVCDGLTVSSQKHYAALWKGDTFYLVNLLTGKSNKSSFIRKWASASMLSAVFSEDEQILISSKSGLLTIWQVEPFQRLADSDTSNTYSGNNIKIDLSKDRSLAVSLSVSKGTTSDRTSQLLVWRVQDAFLLHRINPPFIESSQAMFTCFAFSADGSLIASGDDFGQVHFWSAQGGEELGVYEFSSGILDLTFTPDGTGLAVVLADGTVRLLGLP